MRGIGDTHHIAHALREELLRDGQIADFGHPRRADRPGALHHQDIIGRYVQLRIVNAAIEVVR